MTPAPDRNGHLPDTRRFTAADLYGVRDWDDLRMVLAISRHGNFQAAARALDTDQTTVSRRFKRLEETLGAKLFERDGARLSPTPAGRMIADQAAAMEEIALDVSRRLGGLDALPQGVVKISATDGLGHFWLAAKLAEFARVHPDITFEIVPSHGEYDLVLKNVDIAIGYRRPEPLRLVCRQVGVLPFGAFAAASYLDRAGPAEDVWTLRGHDLVDYDAHHAIPSAAAWFRAVAPDNRLRLRTSSAAIGLAAMRQGVGVGIAPLFYEGRFPEMVRLGCSRPIETEVWLVSHEETRGARRVRLVLDFLKAAFDEDRPAFFSGGA